MSEAMKRSSGSGVLCSVLVVVVAGCTGQPSPGDGTCTELKCDDPLDLPDDQVPDSPCDGVLVDASGRGLSKVAGRLRDPLAEHLFMKGDDCPTTFKGMMAKLRETDTEGDCDPGADGFAGNTTWAVSETDGAQFRTVTSRACGEREDKELLFSLFGVAAGRDLPDGVEIIAFDSTLGVFNFYESDGEQLTFFGNSADMVLDGPGADGQTRRCATCHTGGGLIMKELASPWLHWEGDGPHPNSEDLEDQNPELGFFARFRTLAGLEGMVRQANMSWNERRIEVLRQAGDLRGLLRPLFCSDEVNIGVGASDVAHVLDPLLDPFGAPRAAISLGVIVERADIDLEFVKALVAAGIIDDGFVRDVLMVDFVRSVFSPDRCALVDLLPTQASGALGADQLRTEVLAALEADSPAPGSPAAELIANLRDENDLGVHQENVRAFLGACAGLQPATLDDAAERINSLSYDLARELPVLEAESNPDVLPHDNVDVDRGARLHPKSCLMTTSFVPVR